MNRNSCIYLTMLVNIVCSAIALFAIFILSGCDGGENEIPATEKNRRLLTSGLWTINKVTADGVDKTTDFSGLTLSFQDNTLTTVNGNVVWPPVDTWIFTDGTATVFQRGDGVTVSIAELSANTLVLTLTWSKTTLGPGRTGSIGGNYIFKFIK